MRLSALGGDGVRVGAWEFNWMRWGAVGSGWLPDKRAALSTGVRPQALTACAGLTAVGWSDGVSPAVAGLVLVQIMSICRGLNWVVRCFSDLEKARSDRIRCDPIRDTIRYDAIRRNASPRVGLGVLGFRF